MFFWNSLAFLMIWRMLAIWSLVPLPLLKPAWTSGSSWFIYCWSLAWRILSITLPSVWDECNCAVLWTFFGIGMKIDFFQSYGHCWVFQICWHIECSTFTASHLRIWNSSVLFLVFGETSVLFSVAATPTYIPIHSVQGFLFFQILNDICYLWSFWW